MKLRPLLIIVTILSLSYSRLAAQSNSVWMIGPMIHLNFGGEKTRVSYALELSYWNYEHFPYSFDGGIEFEKQKIRLYGEVQTGIGVAGLACGPLVEFQTKTKAIKGGFQGSLWGNYFLGFDLRFRRVDKTTFVCPGTYFKVPTGIFGKHSNSNGGDHFWSDWDD